MHSIRKDLIPWEGKLVEVKRDFWIKRVKDVEAIKKWLNADVLLQRDGKYYFCETIQEAEVIEEFTNEELNSLKAKLDVPIEESNSLETNLDVPNE